MEHHPKPSCSNIPPCLYPTLTARSLLSSLDTMITTMESKVLLQRIKEIVYAIEPTAQIFLYGSRARDDARPESSIVTGKQIGRAHV